jgi:translation initiation factor 1
VDDEKFSNNPFAALGPVRGSVPAPETPQPLPPSGAPEAKLSRAIARAVIRLERTGRGGKEVTVVEQLGLSGSDLEKWLKELKSALGCGGVVEGPSLVLQGDHRKRLPDVLAKRGVKRVTIG